MEKILAAALAVSAVSAFADTTSLDGFYVGGGVSYVRQDWDDTKWNPVEVFGGYKHSPYVGAEIRLGGFGGGNDPKLNNYQSIYYRTESSNTTGKAYLLMGYTRAELEAYGDKYTFDGFSYGVGIGFVISNNFNLNLEYKVLANADGSLKQSDGTRINGLDMKLSSVSATLDYRFNGTALFSGSDNSSSRSSYDSDFSSSGPYVFGDVATTKIKVSGSDEDDGSFSYSDNFTGFDVGVGYKINNNFAVEAAYKHLGSITEKEENFKSKLSFSALQISAVGTLPINDSVGVYGRLGITKINIDFDFSDEEESDSTSASEHKVIYGVGARYALNDKIGLRLEADRFGKWEGIQLTTVSLGVDYSF